MRLPLVHRAGYLLVLFFVPACAQPISKPSTETPERYIIMLPGVDGGAWQLDATTRGLRNAGVNGEFDVITWGVRPFGTIANLTDIKANQQRAVDISQGILDHELKHPSQPITLIGYSGGAGLALMVAEALPNRPVLDRLILAGAAISPQHDLTQAMARCRHGIVNLYSGADWLILGAGTRIFGTVDRVNTAAAGLVGFKDANGNLRCEPGLRQVAWSPAWYHTGHWGDHLSWLAGNWAKEILAPIVLGIDQSPPPQTAGTAPQSGGQPITSETLHATP